MPGCPTKSNARGTRPPVIYPNEATRINAGPPPTAMPAPGQTAQQRAFEASDPSHASRVAQAKQVVDRRQAFTAWQRQYEDTWPR
ncbi:hypothetical protein MY10362_009063 [Beauveria mimosiformis]